VERVESNHAREWIFRGADWLSGTLIVSMLIFAPWAFGITQPWSIRWMNWGGYLLGLLWVAKRFTRPALTEALTPISVRVCAALSVATLLYILISALNASATFDPTLANFVSREHLRWLPSSVNASATWKSFRMYLALTASFWATYGWLNNGRPFDGKVSDFLLSRRFRLLLWILTLNGAALAMEGVLQRMEGSGKLLFLVRPRIHTDAASQFGPYAYRSNGAQYLNLIWPVVAGWWLAWQRAIARGGSARQFGRQQHHVLLILALVIAVAPMVSTSRGGALILGIDALLITIVLWLGLRGDSWMLRGALLAGVVTALVFGGLLGWKELGPRMKELRTGFSAREEMYGMGRKMFRDYPAYGMGAGTFYSMAPLYVERPDQYQPAQLHHDWLETLATFGVVGSTFIWVALLTIFTRWFEPGSIRASRYFVWCVWIALAGCMIHARWDFPFQVYSVVHVFLTLCAVLMAVAGKTGERAKV
jgi:hypothetical protein